MDSYSVDTLPIIGYDAPVPNTLWSTASETLLVMLPGLGYTNQMPVMFYLREMAFDRLWDVLEVNYDYRALPATTTQEEWTARMRADVHPTIERALLQGSYTRVVLAGKSIGTLAMASVLERGLGLATTCVWITPLLRNASVQAAMRNHTPAVAIYGDADPAVQGVDFAPLAQAGNHLIVLPDVDHGLKIAGAVPESIAALARAIRELDTWINRAIPTTGETV